MEEKQLERKRSGETDRGKQNFLQRLRGINACTPERLNYKVLFFACYAGYACLYTFIPLYFKQLGLSASQTGILIGLRPLCQAIGAPFWGILADKYKARKLVLLLGSCAWLIKNLLILAIRPSHEGCVAKPLSPGNESQSLYAVAPSKDIAIPSISTATSISHNKYKYFVQVDNDELARIFYIFLALVLVGELFGSIVHPLLDGCAVDYLGDERKSYGRIRLWGSVGMVIANLMAGLLINHYVYHYCGQTRKDYATAFYLFAAFMGVTILLLFFVKIVYSETLKQSLRDIKQVFNSRLKLSFWFVAIAFGMSDGFQGDFNSWFLDELKATSFQVGLAAALHFTTSALCYFAANYFLEMLGYFKTIAIGMACYCIVFICYSFTHSPWVALALFAVIGGVFAVTWTACVAYVGSISTAIGLGAAAQGILNGLFVGIGNGSGTMLGGLLVSKTGIRVAYRLFAAFLALVMLSFLACQWQGDNTDDKTSYRALPNKDEEDSNE